MKIEVEDIEGNKYSETIPKYPSAEIVNQCEATFNATVSSNGGSGTGKIDNAYEAISKQKQLVVEWLNENYFGNDLGPERLAPPSQKKIMVKYSDYIEGFTVQDEQHKKKEEVADEEKQD